MHFEAAAADRESGFTLLEVIIAFAISTLAVALLFGGTTGGLGATEIAARTTEALLLARSHLTAIGSGDSIAPREQSGIDGDGYGWELRIRQLGSRELKSSDSERAPTERPTDAVLYDVLVTEHWEDGPRHRAVTLETCRLDFRSADAQ